jgi:hypothetical protein
LERINNRIDNSFCFENHFIRGIAKMKVPDGRVHHDVHGTGTYQSGSISANAFAGAASRASFKSCLIKLLSYSG